jgi:type VI secretion system secreted protein Hcp
MGLSIYCTITGAKQGTFKGESPLKQHAQSFHCLGFGNQVSVPYDKPTGHVAGKRAYEPVKVIKELGVASPQLLQACVTNELLTVVVFDFYRPTAAGEEELAYKVQLINALIVGINQSTSPSPSPYDGRDQDFKTHELEEVAFTFQTIEVEWIPGGTVFQDDWTANP